MRRASWRGTPVAVKSLQRDAAEVGEAPARAFTKEMQVLARLKHPNVVPVFGVCHHADGRVSLVEELEAGGTLYRRLHPAGSTPAPAPMGPGEVARVGLDIARALAFAHAAGITHNDIKSVNVLFHAGGAAVLADFGLAKRVRTALPTTHAGILSSTGGGGGGLLGTVQYTAPENFDDEGEGYGQPPGDVYSFGLLLLEMATGSTPWLGKNVGQVVAAVGVGRRPLVPQGVNGGLRALVERCWAQDPGARPTAAALVAELAELCHREGGALGGAHPEAAAPAQTTQHQERGGGGVALQHAAPAAALGRWGGIGDAPPAPAPLSVPLAPQRWPCAACTYINQPTSQVCEVCTASRGAAATPPLAPLPPSRPVAPQQHSPPPRDAPAAAIGGGGGGGAAAAPATPAPAAPAAAPTAFLPGYRGGSLTGRYAAQLRHGGSVWGLAVLEGGQLVSGGSNNLRVWDPATGENVATMKGWGYKIAALPRGRFVTAGGGDNKAEVWSAASRTRILEFTGHNNSVNCVASLPNNLAASGSDDKTVHIWNANSGVHVAILHGHLKSVEALAVLSDGRLASGSLDHTVRLWSVSNPASAPRVLQHGSSVWALAVLDKGILASGCADKKVHLWDVSNASDQPIARLEGHTSYVRSLAALPRGLLASGSKDKTVRVWNVSARTCVAVLQGHTADVFALAALPDGRLASGSDGDDGVIRVWELRPQTQAEAQAEAQVMAQRRAEAQLQVEIEAKNKSQCILQ